MISKQILIASVFLVLALSTNVFCEGEEKKNLKSESKQNVIEAANTQNQNEVDYDSIEDNSDKIDSGEEASSVEFDSNIGVESPDNKPNSNDKAVDNNNNNKEAETKSAAEKVVVNNPQSVKEDDKSVLNKAVEVLTDNNNNNNKIKENEKVVKSEKVAGDSQVNADADSVEEDDDSEEDCVDCSDETESKEEAESQKINAPNDNNDGSKSYLKKSDNNYDDDQESNGKDLTVIEKIIAGENVNNEIINVNSNSDGKNRKSTLTFIVIPAGLVLLIGVTLVLILVVRKHKNASKDKQNRSKIYKQVPTTQPV